MNAKHFIDTYGKDEAIRIAEQAGTTFEYFRHIAYGNRSASPKLAKKLVEASEHRLTFNLLIFAKRDKAA